jgi:hypothetical protein
MRYLASRVGWAVLFCFVLADSGFAQVGLRVNEAGVRLQVHSDSTVVDLLVENRSGENVSGHVLLELVDPRGIVQSHADQDASLPPGPTKLKIALPPAAAQGEKLNGEIFSGIACATQSHRGLLANRKARPSSEFSLWAKPHRKSSNCTLLVQRLSGKEDIAQRAFGQYIP